MASGPSLVEVAAWRIDLLFFMLLLTSFALTRMDHAVLHYLEKHSKIGFLHIYEAVKEEILLVGCISLLLSGVQDPLSSICINTPRMDDIFPSYVDKSQEYHPDEPYPSPDSKPYPMQYATPSPSSISSPGVATSSPPPPQARRLLSEPSFLKTAALRWRTLLAATDDSSSACPEGYSQLFPVSTMHAVHIMLFLVAVTQILYTFLVLALCLWKLSRWRRFETRAQQMPGLLPHVDKHPDGTGCSDRCKMYRQKAVKKLSKEAKRSPFHHLGVSSVLMFAAVDEEQYIVMRHMFVRQLGLENDFDFLNFVRKSMENEFASLVGVNHYMWFILFLWILCPPETYISIIIPCLHLILALVVGNKLARVTLVFVSNAKDAFYRSQEARDEYKELARTQKNMEVPEWLLEGETSEQSPKSEEEGNDDTEDRGEENEKGEEERETPESMPATPKTVSKDGPGKTMDVSIDVKGSESDRSETEDIATGIREVLSQVMQLNQPRSIQIGPERLSNWGISKWCGMHPAADEAVKHSIEAGKEGKVEEADGSQASQSKMHTWYKKHGKQWVQRTYNKANIDSARLFWGRRPEIMLQLMQMVYFGMSIQLSISLFTAWQKLPPGYLMPVFAPPSVLYDIDAEVSASTIIFEIFTNLFVLLWCALVVLPEYALASTVGSHCPSSVLQYAQRHSVEPKLAKALAAIAQLNKIQAEMRGGTFDEDDELLSNFTGSKAPSEACHETNPEACMEDLYDDIIDLQLAGHSGPLAGGSVSHRKKDDVQKLMGAMYAAQLKKLQDRQLHANDPHLGDEEQHQGSTSTWHAAPCASHTSLTSVKSLFEPQKEINPAANRPASDSGATAEDSGSNSGLSPAQGTGHSPAGNLQTNGWRQKQKLLLDIVQRQENLHRRVTSEDDLLALASTKHATGGAESSGVSNKPPGFSLARHSMTPRVNLDKGSSHQQRPARLPRSISNKVPSKPPRTPELSATQRRVTLGSNLFRISAKPRLETVEDAPHHESEITPTGTSVQAPSKTSIRKSFSQQDLASPP